MFNENVRHVVLIFVACAACKSEISGAALLTCSGCLETGRRMQKAMNVKSKCEPHHTALAAGVMNLLVISALLHFPA